MNYIVLGSLSMSVLGLLLIYITALGIEPETMEIGEVTGEFIGRTVSVEGQIQNQRPHENGHLFLTVTDGGESLQVPIFSNVMSHMDKKEFKTKMKIRVTGLVDDYRGQIQIIPRKPEDIVVLG